MADYHVNPSGLAVEGFNHETEEVEVRLVYHPGEDGVAQPTSYTDEGYSYHQTYSEVGAYGFFPKDGLDFIKAALLQNKNSTYFDCYPIDENGYSLSWGFDPTTNDIVFRKM